MSAPGPVSPAAGPVNTISGTHPAFGNDLLGAYHASPPHGEPADSLQPRQHPWTGHRHEMSRARRTLTALADANEEGAEVQDAVLVAEAESQTSAPNPALTPIQLSLLGLAASQHTPVPAQGPSTASPTAAAPACPASSAELTSSLAPSKTSQPLCGTGPPGKGLDNVAGSLPRSLWHMASGIAQASAPTIAQHLDFSNTSVTILGA